MISKYLHDEEYERYIKGYLTISEYRGNKADARGGRIAWRIPKRVCVGGWLYELLNNMQKVFL